jgi:hypothetical protein
MPPLVGTRAEIEALGDFLATLAPTTKTTANAADHTATVAQK